MIWLSGWVHMLPPVPGLQMVKSFSFFSLFIFYFLLFHFILVLFVCYFVYIYWKLLFFFLASFVLRFFRCYSNTSDFRYILLMLIFFFSFFKYIVKSSKYKINLNDTQSHHAQEVHAPHGTTPKDKRGKEKPHLNSEHGRRRGRRGRSFCSSLRDDLESGVGAKGWDRVRNENHKRIPLFFNLFSHPHNGVLWARSGTKWLHSNDGDIILQYNCFSFL